MLLTAIINMNYKWKVIEDVKMVSFLTEIQVQYTKYSC